MGEYDHNDNKIRILSEFKKFKQMVTDVKIKKRVGGQGSLEKIRTETNFPDEFPLIANQHTVYSRGALKKLQ